MTIRPAVAWSFRDGGNVSPKGNADESESDVLFDGVSARAALSHLIANPSCGVVWLLNVEHEGAGYIVLTIGFSMEYGGLDALVDDLFVRSRFRRKGFGRAALATLFGFRGNDRQLFTMRLPRDPPRS